MKTVTDGATESLWSATVSMPSCPTLTSDLTTDVCIVGAGIGGLMTAYLLQQEGKKVCVIDALAIAAGQTGRTTAHCATALDDRYFDLEKYHGETGAKLAAESHRASLDELERIVQTEKIDCDFKRVTGYLFRSPENAPDILEHELEACQRAGLSDTHLTEVTSPRAFMKGTALCFPNQVQLHPLKFLKAIAELIIERGGQIFTETPVISVKGGEDAQVKTKNGAVIHCQSVVVATNSPINDIFAVHTKQSPYRTYVLGFRVAKDSVDQALYWDTQDPYHYVRLQDGILIVGGEDHKTGQDETPEHRFTHLEKWTRNLFPSVGEIEYRWSGQVMEPVDGLGYLGHNPLDKNNVYIITGDSGNGMTHCTIGAMLIRDQILGRENNWEKIYRPSRVSPRASYEFAKENSNVALQYADWAKPHSSKNDVATLAPGDGIIVREGMKLIAASKNAAGQLETVFGDLHAPWRHRSLELRGKNVGLPLPRIPLRSPRTSSRRPGLCRIKKSRALDRIDVTDELLRRQAKTTSQITFRRSMREFSLVSL